MKKRNLFVMFILLILFPRRQNGQGIPFSGIYHITVKENEGGFVAPHIHANWAVGQKISISSPEGHLYYEPIADLTETIPYDGEKDYGMYKFDPANATALKLEPGNFIMLFPGEGHMPCIAAGENPAKVKKLVVKIHKSIFE